MPMHLSRFRIEGLHGSRTVDIRLRGNQLVLVGENGSGKSTVANLIHFFLTRQWDRLLSHSFQSIAAEVNGQRLKLRPSDLGEEFVPALARLHRKSSPQLLASLLEDWPPEGTVPYEQLTWRLMDKALSGDVPRRVLDGYIHGLLRGTNRAGLERLYRLNGALRNLDLPQILYLPTYRRIEQDLQAIFPGRRDEVSQMRRSLRREKASSAYTELVEFGMEDVRTTVDLKMTELKDHFRTELSSLTATYLRDVIRGDYTSVDLLPQVQRLDTGALDSILSRTPTTVLSDAEQARLRSMVEGSRTAARIEEGDKVVAHFLVQLINVHEKQNNEEALVRRFVEVCNKYLSGKRLVFDDVAFHVSPQLIDNGTPGRQELEWADLSSGEKQIVSLFSHIYLSGGDRYFVIIDEPEMSLSVPWQRRFLPDILDTGLCEGLVAATHSPFIFDNLLDECTYSLEEFVERDHDVR